MGQVDFFVLISLYFSLKVNGFLHTGHLLIFPLLNRAYFVKTSLSFVVCFVFSYNTMWTYVYIYIVCNTCFHLGQASRFFSPLLIYQVSLLQPMKLGLKLFVLLCLQEPCSIYLSKKLPLQLKYLPERY